MAPVLKLFETADPMEINDLWKRKLTKTTAKDCTEKFESAIVCDGTAAGGLRYLSANDDFKRPTHRLASY